MRVARSLPAPTAAPALRAAVRSDVGRVRERNEDAAHVDPAGRFYLLADGMGGHGAGDVASAMAIDVVRACLAAAAPELTRLEAAPPTRRHARVRAIVDRAIRLANDAVLARSLGEADKRGMGTTLEVVVVVGTDAFVGHVGDSRVYHLRDGVAIQVTSDHTVAEAMRRTGSLSDVEARGSPMRSVLSNTVGVTPAVAVELHHVALRPGDRLLLCSDGLHDAFTVDELGARASDDAIDAALARLVAEACARDGQDNVTGVLVELTPAGDPIGLVLDEIDPLDEEPTQPIAVPTDGPVNPLAGVGDDALSAVVDQRIRESSRPIVRPRDRS